MIQLQSKGVSAGIVQTTKDLVEDPQLKDFLWWMKHGEIGDYPYNGWAFHLSRTPAEPKMPSPLIGEHTEFVCREILHMSDEEFVELLADGVFE